jgi:membrane-associated protease RseP (regulator of RpoE activity)
MNAALTVLGWVLFILGIGASIALHEIGHLVPAKRFGVKVTQYMVGFGPTIWSRHKGETEYGVKAIPLGGYIRMIGMYPPERNADGTLGDPTKLRVTSTGRVGAMIADARRTSLEEIGPDDVDRVFYRLPVRQKLVVMFGGPVMNLVIAAVLFTIALCAIGLPTQTNLISAVSPCLPSRAQVQQDISTGTFTPRTCDENSQPSPAAAAGLVAGDRVTAFNTTPVATWTDLQDQIRNASPGPAQLQVEAADGTSRTVTADLIAAPRAVVGDDGQLEIQEGTFLGVTPDAENVPEPITAVPGYMWDVSTRSAKAILTLPVRVWDLAASTFGASERDPEGLVGVVGVGRISGEVTATERLESKDKAYMLVGLLAGLNLFLFLFNLIPLLPLDGGHIAGALWEGLRRWLAKLRGRADPGPVDVARALPLAYGVAFLMIAMAGLLVYADLFDPIQLGL